MILQMPTPRHVHVQRPAQLRLRRYDSHVLPKYILMLLQTSSAKVDSKGDEDQKRRRNRK